MRPRHQATLMQPLQSDLQIPNCKTQKNYAQRREKLQLQNRMDLGTKPKKTINAAITMRLASTRRRTPRENRLRSKRSNRTRRTHEVRFIASCSHFTRKNRRFRAPASSPKQTPSNSHAATITLRFAATRSRPSYPPGGEKCNIHFWSATMPGFGTLALYHIYPHICRLSYPKS